MYPPAAIHQSSGGVQLSSGGKKKLSSSRHYFVADVWGQDETSKTSRGRPKRERDRAFVEEWEEEKKTVTPFLKRTLCPMEFGRKKIDWNLAREVKKKKGYRKA